MITLTAIATCPQCGVLAEGTMAEADKAADAHTRKTRHATAMVAVPERKTTR